MRTGGRVEVSWVRLLAMALLAFCQVRAPLPQPDFHNIRHHDGPGEVCPHHDHLLRWHPGAGFATDVAVLHWHWFVPMRSDEAASRSTPALHAHLPDQPATPWDGGPELATEPPSRPDLTLRLADGPPSAGGLVPVADALAGPPRSGRFAAGVGCATAARWVSPAALQRWVC